MMTWDRTEVWVKTEDCNRERSFIKALKLARGTNLLKVEATNNLPNKVMVMLVRLEKNIIREFLTDFQVKQLSEKDMKRVNSIAPRMDSQSDRILDISLNPITPNS